MKKTMKWWQLTMIMVVSVVMLVTMFLPAFTVTEKSIYKTYVNLANNKNISEVDAELAGDKDEILKEKKDLSKDNAKEFNADAEEKYGFSFKKVTPLTIMTKSFLPKADKEKTEATTGSEEEATAETSASYGIKTTSVKIILWVVYVLLILLMIVNILGFCLKMNKKIPLIIDIVYSLIATAFFAYMKFALPGAIASALVKTGNDLAYGINNFDVEISDELAKGFLTDIMKAFASYAFLVAMIAAIVLLIVSIVSLFIGGASSKAVESDWDENDYANQMHETNMFKKMPEAHGGEEKVGFTSKDPEPIGVTEPVGPESVESTMPIPPAVNFQAPMGQVKCTKGMALGQGFMISQDKKVVVGKSRNNANLIINHPTVSNVHCTIYYNPIRNSYIVKDHSTNGTFVRGVRMQKEVAMEFPAGTVLSLADGNNEITLG